MAHDWFRQKSNESKNQTDMRIERIGHKTDQERKLLRRDRTVTEKTGQD
jgi:hypothetical protein